MEIKGFLIAVSEIAGAIATIIGLLVTIEKWSKGKLTNWLLKPFLTRMDNLDNKVFKLDEKVSKIELDNLKLIIVSNEVPLEERLQAGERYVNMGGNSAIKIHYKELQKEYEESIRNK